MDMIVQEEKRLEMEGEDKLKNGAYFAKNRRKDKDKKKAERPTCKHCKKKGHTEDKCYQLHLELRPNN